MTTVSPAAPATARHGTLLGAILAQTRIEILLTLRRGDNVLVTLILPVLLLVAFASLNIVPSGQSAIGYLLPGILALAVISTGMVSLGIATAYERHYGVLKRLGGTPLPRGGLIAAKTISVLLIEVVQVILLAGIGIVAYGWRPGVGALPAVAVLLLGTVAFTGIGLAMAGRLRAEATLAGANGLYLVFLLIGDIVVPLSHLPGPLRAVARILPPTALSESLRRLIGSGGPNLGWNLLLLAVWAVLAIAVAARTFRWE
jgi:ABC-2 type transport system permease protein